MCGASTAVKKVADGPRQQQQQRWRWWGSVNHVDSGGGLNCIDMVKVGQGRPTGLSANNRTVHDNGGGGQGLY
jgi:hypothetical protein